jgi:hypothetical protein
MIRLRFRPVNFGVPHEVKVKVEGKVEGRMKNEELRVKRLKAIGAAVLRSCSAAVEKEKEVRGWRQKEK